MRKQIINYFLLLVVFFQCTSFKERSYEKDHVIKMIDMFITDEKVSIKDVIIVRVSNFPNEADYLTVITDFDPSMSIGRNEFDKDFGQYKYKGYTISFMAEKGIDISPVLKNKNLEKISDVSFTNESGTDVNYDPTTMKFYVDKNFQYTKPFYNTKLEVKWNKKVRKYLIK